MLRERVTVYRDRVRRELTAAFRADYTAHEVAISFAIGLFVTSMPTGGLSLGALAVLAYWQSWASKAAMFAAAILLNPLVKPAVYLGSYRLGTAFLGSEQLVTLEHDTADTAIELVQFLLVGNVVIGAILFAVGYLIAFHLTRSYRRREGTKVRSSIASASLFPFNRRK